MTKPKVSSVIHIAKANICGSGFNRLFNYCHMIAKTVLIG